MEPNLFTQIIESKYVFDKCTNKDNLRSTTDGQGSSFVDPSNLAKENSNYLLEAKYIISLNNIEKRTESSLLKSNYIVFEIKIIRSSDGEAHSVWKRYKELYTWYYNVSRIHGSIHTSAFVLFIVHI